MVFDFFLFFFLVVVFVGCKVDGVLGSVFCVFWFVSLFFDLLDFGDLMIFEILFEFLWVGCVYVEWCYFEECCGVFLGMVGV